MITSLRLQVVSDSALGSWSFVPHRTAAYRVGGLIPLTVSRRQGDPRPIGHQLRLWPPGQVSCRLGTVKGATSSHPERLLRNRSGARAALVRIGDSLRADLGRIIRRIDEFDEGFGIGHCIVSLTRAQGI